MGNLVAYLMGLATSNSSVDSRFGSDKKIGARADPYQIGQIGGEIERTGHTSSRRSTDPSRGGWWWQRW
ncbi:hypothetical protein V501_02612 [Pseudogymnoascus sp. VKM F-4519 (FW-2642)]|nr:hypothetical protein V501_02612 [Pseudogymnoascus sp. VKM F-4519 (FW-2642)]